MNKKLGRDFAPVLSLLLLAAMASLLPALGEVKEEEQC